MIDFENLNAYRENNRIEAKKAQGGLPQSIWETYSSFANTMGGVILLGVEEMDDKALNPVRLNDPDALVNEFREKINDPKKANKNILKESDISIENVGGFSIIAIVVPRAGRYEKPIYVDNDIKNTYIRTGEGDFRCSMEEIRAMQRDSSVITNDMQVFEDMDETVLNPETVNKFRRRMENCRPGHIWEDLDNREFLVSLGALSKNKNGSLSVTAAGLLMFGKREHILKKFPDYSLNYMEKEAGELLKNRITSENTSWSGNLYDFYFQVKKRLLKTLSVPLIEKKGTKKEDMPVYDSVFEAVSNSIVNADYLGKGGILIVNEKNKVEVSNPGAFRIDLKSAVAGGSSDPRNLEIMKMFNLIDVSDREGRGISHIFMVWNLRNWEMPKISESFYPERITVSLSIGKKEKIRQRLRRNGRTLTRIHREMVIDYLTDNSRADAKTIAFDLNLSISKTQNLLKKLCDDNIVEGEGKTGNRIYELKA